MGHEAIINESVTESLQVEAGENSSSASWEYFQMKSMNTAYIIL